MSYAMDQLAPVTFDDFVISDPASKAQLDSILSGPIPFPLARNTFCIWGIYGTGKTTLAKMLPEMLEGSGALSKSVQAGSGLFGDDFYCHFTSCGCGENGVALMNGLKKRALSSAAYSPSGWHYEILDEVDLLLPIAQASLKSTITEAKSTIFILTTNHLPKIDAGVRDRSILIEMNQPTLDAMEAQGRRFLRKLGLAGTEVESEKLREMAAASRGSMRSFVEAIAIAAQKFGAALTPV